MNVRFGFSSVAIAFYAALAMVGVVWMRWRGDDLGLVFLASKVPAWAALGLGVLAGALALVVSDRFLARYEWTRQLRSDVSSAFAPLDRVKALALAGASAIGEEVFFRGALLPAIGLVGSSLVFGALHTSFDRQLVGWTIFAVVAGFGFGALFLATGGLLAPIAAHAVINGVELWRIATSRRGPIN